MELNYNDLVADLKLYRLNEDLAIIEKGLSENVQDETEEKNFFKKIGKNVSNSVKRSRTEGLEKNKKQDEDEIAKIKAIYPDCNGTVEDLQKKIADSLTSEDGKAAFAISYLLSDTHEYKEDEDTLKKVSSLLYGNETRLVEIKKNVNSHYNKVVNGLFSSLKANDAILLSLQGYVISLANLTKNNTAYELAKSTISSLNGKEEDKKEAITMTSLLLMGRKGMVFSKDEEGKEAFFNAKKETVQSGLALRAYLFATNKAIFSEEDVKNNTKSILASLSQLSYTLQIKMILEKVDQDNAKDKMNAINNFIADIADLMK